MDPKINKEPVQGWYIRSDTTWSFWGLNQIVFGLSLHLPLKKHDLIKTDTKVFWAGEAP